jgi:hypothetical protein
MLGSLRRMRIGGAVAIVAAVFTTAAVGVADRAGVSGQCSRATAVKLAVQHAYGEPFGHPQLGFICGHFTGTGSTAMAAIYHSGTCLPFQGFSVFHVVGGVWKQVLPLTDFGVESIKAAGSNIRETVPVFRKGDFRCNPSGGERFRIWHWNGRRLVPGPWAPSPLVHVESFYSADRKLWCRLGSRQAYCGKRLLTDADGPRSFSALMNSAGDVTLCDVSPQTHTNACVQNDDPNAVVLRVGQRNELYGFRCTSDANGITCTVLAGAGKGKGFQINANGPTRVGP